MDLGEKGVERAWVGWSANLSVGACVWAPTQGGGARGELPTPLIAQPRINSGDLLSDTSGLVRVEALGRHVDNVRNVLELAVAEGARRRDRGVLARREELEAVRILAAKVRLRADLQDMQLMTLPSSPARLHDNIGEW